MTLYSDTHRLIQTLAEDRIKHGVDYAIVFKYQKRRVFCCETFKRRIEEVAAELEVKIDEIVTYNYFK